MAEPNLIGGVVGGALIGLAAVLLLAVNGRIAGVSGIVGALVTGTQRGERAWRIAFVAGLVAGAAAWGLARGGLGIELQAQGIPLLVAGVLVGVGTRLGSGCTSGHGVCGLARRSPRSLSATATFIGVAIATVFVVRHALA